MEGCLIPYLRLLEMSGDGGVFDSISETGGVGGVFDDSISETS